GAADWAAAPLPHLPPVDSRAEAKPPSWNGLGSNRPALVWDRHQPTVDSDPRHLAGAAADSHCPVVRYRHLPRGPDCSTGGCHKWAPAAAHRDRPRRNANRTAVDWWDSYCRVRALGHSGPPPEVASRWASLRHNRAQATECRNIRTA